MQSADLKKQLENTYKLVCFEDLASVSNSYEFIYELLYRCRKDVFDDNERLIFYSSQTPDVELLSHFQTALRDVDISNWFVLIVCPGDIKSDLNYVRVHNSYDDCSINQQELLIEDGSTLKSKSQYTRSNTICPLPWSNIEIRANGDLTPCCVFNISTLTEKININEHSLSDFYHSDSMNKLRQQLASGEKPAGCQTCWNREASGVETQRILSDYVYQRHFKTKSLDDVSLNRVVNLDIDLGNLCNLKCRICSWKRSSLIAAEAVTKRKIDNVIQINTWNKNSQWIQNDNVWDKFDPVVDNLVNLEIEGGEPFFYNYQLPWLDQLCETGKSKNIRLRHSTNATIFPSDRIQSWKKFKRVQLELSVDDIEQRIEYQRDGTDWAVVEDVLKKYKNLQSELDNLDISFYVTVSLQNVLYIPELLKYCQPFDWDIHLTLLHDPKNLSIFNLNATAKELVLSKFKTFSQTDPDLYSKLIGIEQAVKTVVPTDPKHFIQEMKELDQIRGQSFLETHPEIAQALGY